MLLLFSLTSASERALQPSFIPRTGVADARRCTIQRLLCPCSNSHAYNALHRVFVGFSLRSKKKNNVYARSSFPVSKSGLGGKAAGMCSSHIFGNHGTNPLTPYVTPSAGYLFFLVKWPCWHVDICSRISGSRLVDSPEVASFSVRSTHQLTGARRPMHRYQGPKIRCLSSTELDIE